jgi:hypothetical protein
VQRLLSRTEPYRLEGRKVTSVAGADGAGEGSYQECAGQYHSWGYTQKTVTPETPAHPCLLWHYSQ